MSTVMPLSTTPRTAAAPTPQALDRMVKREIDPALLKEAAAHPVDALVFYKAATSGNGIASAMNALAGAEALPRGAERKSLVYNAVSTIGKATLAQVQPVLTQLSQTGQLAGTDNLATFNAVHLRGATAAALKALAGPNVLRIVPNDTIALPQLPDPTADAINGASMVPWGHWQSGNGAATPKPGDAPANDPVPPMGHEQNGGRVFMDWGVKKMDAPAAWAQGITGAGIVVASLDTGVIVDHSGLKANFRGTKADGSMDYNYNLWNGVEKGAKYPIDDVGHGTHTIGNVLGNNAANLTGVAPDAKFIAARGLGEKGGSLFALMAGMEWMMAPTDLDGKNPRPDLAPDIVTNSWGGASTSNPFLYMALRNWRRAGIVPVFAAGNALDPKPGQVSVPGMYGETITAGATNKDDSRAFFSMYGPSDFANDRKPEVMGPGRRTYSTYPDGTYRDTFTIDGKIHEASGTSMATPHVAGAVALYMQAHPNASYDQILKALEQASTLASAPTQDRGYGRVQLDKLIAPGTIDANATLASSDRVKQLMGEVAKAEVFGETPDTYPADPPGRFPEPGRPPYTPPASAPADKPATPVKPAA